MATCDIDYTVLSIDPGTSNLAACVFLVSKNGDIGILSTLIDAVGRNAQNCHRFATAAYEALETESQKLNIPENMRFACIESQQVGPQRDETHVRDNTYVEACVTTRLVSLMDTKKILVLSPSAVKRSLCLCTSGYATNKLASLMHANDNCVGFAELGNKSTHHYADCFCMVHYLSKIGAVCASERFSVAANS